MTGRLAEQGVERRKEIMNFIRRFRRQHGYSPTVVEIGEGVGIASPHAVAAHVDTGPRHDNLPIVSFCAYCRPPPCRP